MTSPTSSTAPYAPNPIAFGICSALFGAALAITIEISLIATFGADPSVGVLMLLAFVGIVLGAAAGLACSVKLSDDRPALAAAVAPTIYLLTMLTLPFLLYVIGALLFLDAFQSYQF